MSRDFDDKAFSAGWYHGWDAAKVLDWLPLHELEESADLSRRAGDYEDCGYWCGYKSGQECHNSRIDQPLTDSAGMLISY